VIGRATIFVTTATFHIQYFHHAFLQGSKAAFDCLGRGMGETKWEHQGEKALCNSDRSVIGHGIMAKEAQAVGVHNIRQGEEG